MAETINGLNINIVAKDNFSASLDKLGKSLDKVSAKAVKSSKQLDKNAQAFANFDKASKSTSTNLKNINKNLDKLSTISKSASSGVKTLGNTSSSASTKVNKLSLSFGNLAKSMGSAILRTALTVAGINSLGEVIGDGIARSMQYTETMNLFSVTMGEYAESATQYAESVSALMGIDPSEWMKYQGTFQAIIRGFGVGAEQAAYMSQNLTQLGYDISSFENLDIDTAMLKIQSGLAGEIEPLRRIGYDLSQSRLTEIANDPNTYGNMVYSINELTGAIEGYSTALDENTDSITVNFDELSQLDKVQLRYIAMMHEMEFVQGDFSRTLNDPANMLRVFRENVHMASRSLGNIFIPAINRILPYLTAVMQVLQGILARIAAIFGYQLPDMSDRVDVGNAVGGYEDIEDAMEGAAGSAKKLRDYTIGLDELNVLRPDDNSGGGSGNNNYSAGGGSYNVEGYDFIGQATNARVEHIKEQIQEFIEAIKNGADSIGIYFANLFNDLLDKWENPFLDGAKFGQAIADALDEANDFLEHSDTFLLGHKIGEWTAGTVQGSNFVYEVASFGINILTSGIKFIGGFLAGLDITNTGDSFLGQVLEALMRPMSDDLYGGHFENGEWVITDLDLTLRFNTRAYANNHPIVAGIGDWIGDLLGIGDRFNGRGEYVATVPIDVRLDAVTNLANSVSGLSGLFNMSRHGTDYFQQISLGLSDDAKRIIESLSDTIITSIEVFVRSISGFIDILAPFAGLSSGFFDSDGLLEMLDGIEDSFDAWAGNAAQTWMARQIEARERTRNYTPGRNLLTVGLRSNVDITTNTGTHRRNGIHAASAYIGGYNDEINSRKDEIESSANSLIDSFNKGIGNLNENSRINANDYLKGFTDTISSNVGLLSFMGNSASKAFIDGVGNLGASSRNSANDFTGNFLNTISANVGNFSNSGLAIGKVFADGMNAGINSTKSTIISSAVSIKDEVVGIISSAMDATKGIASQMSGIGQQVASGLSKGITNTASINTVTNSSNLLARTAVSATKGTLGIHSPSKVFEEIGEYAVEGFNLGFENESSRTYGIVEDFAKQISSIDSSNLYSPKVSASIPNNSVSAVNGSQTDGTANMAMAMFEAVNTALQSNRNDNATQGDTKIYINGREIFKVVQEESRKNGVSISNGAFVGG